MSMLRARLKVRAKVAGTTDFVFNRASAYAAKLLQRRGVPVSVIMQIGGSEASEMVRGYVREYEPTELKQFPTAARTEYHHLRSTKLNSTKVQPIRETVLASHTSGDQAEIHMDAFPFTH